MSRGVPFTSRLAPRFGLAGCSPHPRSVLRGIYVVDPGLFQPLVSLAGLRGFAILSPLFLGASRAARLSTARGSLHTSGHFCSALRAPMLSGPPLADMVPSKQAPTAVSGSGKPGSNPGGTIRRPCRQSSRQCVALSARAFRKTDLLGAGQRLVLLATRPGVI